MGDGGTKKQGSFGNQKPSVTGLKLEMTINHILLKVAGKAQTCKCCVPRSASQWMTRYPRLCFLFQKRVSRTQADSCRQPLIQMEPVGQSEWGLVLNRGGKGERQKLCGNSRFLLIPSSLQKKLLLSIAFINFVLNQVYCQPSCPDGSNQYFAKLTAITKAFAWAQIIFSVWLKCLREHETKLNRLHFTAINEPSF